MDVEIALIPACVPHVIILNQNLNLILNLNSFHDCMLSHKSLFPHTDMSVGGDDTDIEGSGEDLHMQNDYGTFSVAPFFFFNFRFCFFLASIHPYPTAFLLHFFVFPKALNSISQLFLYLQNPFSTFRLQFVQFTKFHLLRSVLSGLCFDSLSFLHLL